MLHIYIYIKAMVIEPKVTCALFWDLRKFLEKFYIEKKKSQSQNQTRLSRLSVELLYHSSYGAPH